MLYKEILSQCPELKFQRINEACNYSYFPVIFPSEATLLSVEKKLNAEGIYPRRYFYPSVNTFTQILPYVEMPVSEDISKKNTLLAFVLWFGKGGY